jgi:hypothetical protein
VMIMYVCKNSNCSSETFLRIVSKMEVLVKNSPLYIRSVFRSQSYKHTITSCKAGAVKTYKTSSSLVSIRKQNTF